MTNRERHNARMRKYFADPQKRAKYNGQRARRRQDPEYRERLVIQYWKHLLKKRYGITLEQYEKMFQKQDGKCAICLKPSIKRLAVDHNHDTGKVRGLLCSNCNPLLGFATDSITILENAVAYLKRNLDA
jgi:Recombination endonuclease VII